LQRDKEISEEEGAKISNEHQAARAELSRRLASQTWLIPDENRTIIRKLMADLSRSKFTDWTSLVVEGSESIDAAVDQLRANVRKELSLGS
jgi:hypothetical protein